MLTSHFRKLSTTTSKATSNKKHSQLSAYRILNFVTAILGRPCTTWMKNIHDDMSSLDLGIHEARDLAQNRPLRRLMSLHSATHLDWNTFCISYKKHTEYSRVTVLCCKSGLRSCNELMTLKVTAVTVNAASPRAQSVMTPRSVHPLRTPHARYHAHTHTHTQTAPET